MFSFLFRISAVARREGETVYPPGKQKRFCPRKRTKPKPPVTHATFHQMSLPITVEYRQRLLKNLLSGCSSEVYFVLLLLRASSHQPEALCAFSNQTTLFVNAFAFIKLMNASYTRFFAVSTPVFQNFSKYAHKFIHTHFYICFSIFKKLYSWARSCIYHEYACIFLFFVCSPLYGDTKA